jgi:alpha-galactosidase
MMSAPLLIGTDLRKATPQTLSILGNKDVIALDQDLLGKQATVQSSAGGGYVLTKQLANGDRAVALFNSSDAPRHIATTATAAGLPKRSAYAVRDLWRHTGFETAGTLAATVPAHGTVLLRVSADPATAAKALLAPSLLDAGTATAQDHLEPGQSGSLTTRVTDLGLLPAMNVGVHLDPPAGWTLTPGGATTRTVLGKGATLTTAWKVTVPVGTRPGTYPLNGTVTYRSPAGRSVTVPLPGSVTVLVPPPAGTSYLSDLSWTSATNGWGPVEKDTSNGEAGAGDGNPITLAGTVYTKGLGAHAPSAITYYLGGKCSAVDAVVGVDDEKNGKGTVDFQVSADGTTVADSGVLDHAAGGKPLHADVTGAQSIQLVVTDGGDGNDSDHADWADARITCS